VIAADTDILVYAHREDSGWHTPACQIVSAYRALKALIAN
jgi:hypothetical protein